MALWTRTRCGGLLAAGALLLAGAGCGSLPGMGAAPGGSASATTVPTTAATQQGADVADAAESSAPSPRPRATRPSSEATKGPSAAPTKPRSSTAPAVLSPGDDGARVRELQHRLRQLDWYAGAITGRYRSSTVAAVRGFQDKRGLTASGAVDQKTWTSLTSRTRTPSDDEMHDRLRPGPALLRAGSSGDRVRDLQARLRQLAWFSGPVASSYGPATTAAVRGFQGKRGIPVTGEVDQRTLDRLRAMTRTPSSDELHNRTRKPSAAGLDRRCLSGRAICVSKTSNTLTWVVDGRPQLRMDVRFGSAELPTREGAFAIGWKSRDHVSTIYHTKMPYAMFFSGGQAVHYSPDFAARGYNGASHGCVNVRNLAGVQALFSQTRVGDKVIVYR